MTRSVFLNWLRIAGRELEANKGLLTQLDAAIGDADHGINMDRGFSKILEQLPTLEDHDIGGLLKSAGMALVSSVGGAAGPLYGTFFLRAGASVEGRWEIGPNDLARLLREGVRGVAERGKAAPGAKTMLDALSPAVDALEAALGSGADIALALRECVAAADKGMKDTIPLVATKGRASYLGERSAGHQDPGATSSYLILRALAEALESHD
ncbi:MAG: dihydroxyacetone kinase subunit DhaL [Chloroflexi bacterium]|nr:dihydroxyacetone kinase subunit DhaL [Chloroflexota bacterium]